MIGKENKPIFQYLGINLMENVSKITIDQINYAETSNQLIMPTIKLTKKNLLQSYLSDLEKIKI